MSSRCLRYFVIDINERNKITFTQFLSNIGNLSRLDDTNTCRVGKTLTD